MKNIYAAFIYLFCISLSFPYSSVGQTSIDWQKSIGTQYYDYGLKLVPDEDGSMIVLGQEVHQDITGDLRNYLVSIKYDVTGQELWKQYHDVAHETFSPPIDYQIGEHFYTEEFGVKLINFVMKLSNRVVLYKLYDDSGEYYSFEDIPSTMITLDRENNQVYASTTCSIQPSCYGPDSLILQRKNAVADSNFNVIAWTFGLRQNLRTAAIQGHYDFDVNDIATDSEGNIYVLVQIERWDFQFCTDCNDVFIDGWSMVYKFDPDGNEIGHKRLNITKAVVSSMQFLSLREDAISIRINDINAAGTQVLTSIFRIDEDLNIEEDFTLDRSYLHLITDAGNNIYGITNVYDPADPNIKGESDVLVVKFNGEGVKQWESYYGGSSFDYPRGFTSTSDGGLAFIANTESIDFDIAENHGQQDIWLVKLSENTTAVGDEDAVDLKVFPNPTSDHLYISSHQTISSIHVVDMFGKIILNENLGYSNGMIHLGQVPAGPYVIKVIMEDNNEVIRQLTKLN